MKHLIIHLKFAVFFLLLTTAIFGCKKDRMDRLQPDVNERFFAYSKQVRLVEDVIYFLKERNDSANFINRFIEDYGLPVWDKNVEINVDDENKNHILILVPISQNAEEEINTIWMFDIIPNFMRYYPVIRYEVTANNQWPFDYFTQEILKKTPRSGHIFKPDSETTTTTRGSYTIRRCNEIWTGTSSTGLTYRYTHCWNEIINYPDFRGGGGGRMGPVAFAACTDEGDRGGGGGGYSPSPTPVPNENQEVILDDSFKDTKAECVYDKLMSLSGGFKNAIQKFDGEFPVSHLRFTLEDLGSIRGQSRPPGKDSPNYIITIALNNNGSIDGINYRPNLMIAKTIIHEAIHAEMFRKLLSLAKQGSLNFDGWSTERTIKYLDDIKNNYPGIYDYYRRHKNWQHQQMATHYIETLASSLKDFDNGKHSEQFYKDIAWEGLMYDNIYTWTSKSQAEKDKINKVISDYINANKNQSCQ